jgi:peroxiredoxin
MTRRMGAPLALVVLTTVCAVSFLAAANQAPVARIAAYRAAAGAGTAVVYDGSQSSDPDGQVVGYQWLFGDGTTGSGSPVTHSYAQPSSLTVTLLVRDNSGATGLVTQVIDVASLPSQASGSANSAAAENLAAQVPIGDDVGQRGPEFALPNLRTDGIVHLSDYLGKTVLIEFWVSTCPGCQASTSQLETWRATYAGEGLVVLLVVLDRTPSAAITFLERYGYTSFVLAWESDASKPTMTAYGVAVTPTSFLIDRTGVIRYTGHPSGLSDQFIQRWL